MITYTYNEYYQLYDKKTIFLYLYYNYLKEKERHQGYHETEIK